MFYYAPQLSTRRVPSLTGTSLYGNSLKLLLSQCPYMVGMETLDWPRKLCGRTSIRYS